MSTSDTESRYSAIDLEATACEWALNKTRMYHEGRTVIVLSDHQALKHLMTTDNSIKSRRLQQLYVKMQGYNTKWRYRPGAQQKVADHLSRYPTEAYTDSEASATNFCDASRSSVRRSIAESVYPPRERREDDQEFGTEEMERLGDVFVAELVISPIIQPNNDHEVRRKPPLLEEDLDIRHWQGSDQPVAELIRMLSHSGVPSSEVFTRKDLSDFILLDGILYHQGNDNVLKQVIPIGLQRYILELAHDTKTSAHAGQIATYEAVAERGWWPTMKSDIINYVKSCELCQSVRKGPRQQVAIMPHYVGKPMQDIAIDIIGPGPVTPNGNRYILSIIDLVTRWAEAIPMKTMSGDEIAYHLQREWCSRYGIPKSVLSDQGQDLIAGVMKKLMKLYQVKWKVSTPEHPQSNGLVERFNKSIQLILTKLLIQEPMSWDEILPYALQAYRGTYHETLHMAPYKATFGSGMTTIMDLKFPEQPNRITDELLFEQLTTTERVAYLRNLQEELIQFLNEQQRLREGNVEPTTTQLIESYHVGDQVWLYHPSRVTAKFTPLWTGPHEIIEIRPPVNLVIREVMKNREEIHAVHVSRTKLFVRRAPKPKEFPSVLLWDESVDIEPWDKTEEELRKVRESTQGDVREDASQLNAQEEREAVPEEEVIAGQRYEEVESIVGHGWSLDNSKKEVHKGRRRPPRPRLWYHLKYKGFQVNPKDWYLAAEVGKGCRDIIKLYKEQFPQRKLPEQFGNQEGFDNV